MFTCGKLRLTDIEIAHKPKKINSASVWIQLLTLHATNAEIWFVHALFLFLKHLACSLFKRLQIQKGKYAQERKFASGSGKIIIMFQRRNPRFYKHFFFWYWKAKTIFRVSRPKIEDAYLLSDWKIKWFLFKLRHLPDREAGTVHSWSAKSLYAVLHFGSLYTQGCPKQEEESGSRVEHSSPCCEFNTQKPNVNTYLSLLKNVIQTMYILFFGEHFQSVFGHFSNLIFNIV